MQLKDIKEIQFDNLFIDFGIKSKKELELYGIKLKSIITPVSRHNDRFVVTKAWDEIKKLIH